MSTKDPSTASSAPTLRSADVHAPILRATAERLFEKLDGDGTVCSRCFGRIRRPHDHFAEEIQRQGQMGYYDEEKLLTVTATSSPEPATFREPVPATTFHDDRPRIEDDDEPIELLRYVLEDKGDYKPSRAKTICDCGTIDEIDDTRSRGLMHECVSNLAERLADVNAIQGIAAVSLEHAHAVIDAAYDNRITGCDQDVLERALVVGMQHA